MEKYQAKSKFSIFLKLYQRKILIYTLRLIFLFPVLLFVGSYATIVFNLWRRSKAIPGDLAIQCIHVTLLISFACIPILFIAIVWNQWDVFRKEELKKCPW